MFDTASNDQFDPTQSGSITNLDAQFGINGKNSDIVKASSCSLTLDADPWSEDKTSSVKANTNASTDDLTGGAAHPTDGEADGGGGSGQLSTPDATLDAGVGAMGVSYASGGSSVTLRKLDKVFRSTSFLHKPTRAAHPRRVSRNPSAKRVYVSQQLLHLTPNT